uniref:Uncharacterized protein n=1 Tax=Attheya septentrionalis TaxID=420275 RepID=A0A7S2XTH0_9STRA|mmetsp:Transcript_7808/g.14073  ORF Transcript_7808/g.14073 Transcript_7808/m.14073 type:complete len:458 (+) Transcript_7808:160-1533(+)|eukprot:CAMPEP_0198290490 /NCGR_PEP_ID=MMETSP1449-20131203/8337_1 /TAXON_ID=420275 /ORGANISM="Attheya septentrionalis, Strain CCMP2084" /LENGTH=457 /DNA_ID=CAMNT_0043988999 /DNA_START=61 /DNA_END=1434 /DNA_ORIENTATION=-
MAGRIQSALVTVGGACVILSTPLLSNAFGVSSVTRPIHVLNEATSPGILPSFVRKSCGFVGSVASPRSSSSSSRGQKQSSLHIFAPPASGYSTQEDETNKLPESYDPMMEFPGTMRPGRTPENMPFHDLPIGDDDPDPVPWPHFQEIDWHHNWGSPHDHPVPMEEVIENEGRWATVEEEADLRAGARRGVRERREAQEAGQGTAVIMDDEDDDDEGADDVEEQVDLGQGLNILIGSESPSAIDVDATTIPTEVESTLTSEDEEEDEDEGDFLLDLGLDGDDDDGDDDDDDDGDEIALKMDDDSGEDVSEPAFTTSGTDKLMDAMKGLIDGDEDDDDDIIPTDGIADDDEDDLSDLDLGDLDLNFASEDDDEESNIVIDDGAVTSATDEDDTLFPMIEEDDDDMDLATDGVDESSGVQMVPIDDLNAMEDLDEDEGYDAGFDYDDSGDDYGGGDTDSW